VRPGEWLGHLPHRLLAGLPADTIDCTEAPGGLARESVSHLNLLKAYRLIIRTTNLLPSVGAMAKNKTPNEIHPVVTRRSGYSYCFSDKHHGLDYEAAQWAVSHEEEFGAFDDGDDRDLSDDKANLYGLLKDSQGRFCSLGTRDEQFARFPHPRKGKPLQAGDAWHGYPIWPLGDAPSNREAETDCPPKEVLVKMVNSGLLSEVQRRQVLKGKYL
jgi:hypothetical protein